jgi:hypothetical protein
LDNTPPTPTVTRSSSGKKKRTNQEYKRMSSSKTITDFTNEYKETNETARGLLSPSFFNTLRRSTGPQTAPCSPTPPTPTSHKSLFSSKFHQKSADLMRQSLPADVHKHKLIEGSFPKGKSTLLLFFPAFKLTFLNKIGLGKCKVCNCTVKNNALVCKGIYIFRKEFRLCNAKSDTIRFLWIYLSHSMQGKEH